MSGFVGFHIYHHALFVILFKDIPTNIETKMHGSLMDAFVYPDCGRSTVQDFISTHISGPHCCIMCVLGTAIPGSLSLQSTTPAPCQWPSHANGPPLSKEETWPPLLMAPLLKEETWPPHEFFHQIAHKLPFFA